jgi:hypothetical protein
MVLLQKGINKCSASSKRLASTPDVRIPMPTPTYTGIICRVYARSKKEAKLKAEQFRLDGADITRIMPARTRLEARTAGRYVVEGRFFPRSHASETI